MSGDPPARAGAMGFLLATVFLDGLAGGLIGPILPSLLRDLSGGGEAAVAHLMGVFIMTFAAVQLFSSPAQGALSDRFGRRPVLLASMAGLGADYLLMATAPSVAWLLVGRVISGIFAGSIAPAYAYVLDISPTESRAAALGRLAAAMGTGAVLGPMIGGWVGELDPRAPFYLAAALSFLAAGYGLLALPESLPAERRSTLDWRRVHPLGAATGLLRDHPSLRRWALTQGALLLAVMGAGGIMAVYSSYRFSWSPGELGTFFMGLALVNIAVQAGLVGPLIARLGEARTVLVGLAFQTLGLLAAGLAGNGVAFAVAYGLVTVGSVTDPALGSLVTRTVRPDQQGAVLGAARSLGSLVAIAAPPLFASLLAASVGLQPAGLPFLVAAAVTVVAVVLALWAARFDQGLAPQAEARSEASG